MTAAIKWNLVPIEDYLAGELDSPVRHEYVGGAVYAMAGARVNHNRISGNAFGSLHARLRGGACHPFGPDMKVRVRLEKETRFYYPDLSVVCESNPPDDLYQDAPTVVLEVVSPSTRRVDEEEKKEAYLTIASLGAYLIVEQEAPAVLVYRRGLKAVSPARFTRGSTPPFRSPRWASNCRWPSFTRAWSFRPNLPTRDGGAGLHGVKPGCPARGERFSRRAGIW